MESLFLVGPRMGITEEKQPLWEKLPESERGRSILASLFLPVPYFIFLSFIVLIPLRHEHVTLANGVGRNQLP